MSNSTRPGGYDERLVVPLEASRRGAHRARTNPLVAALPLLAVVVVVAAVIGVAYTLFLRPGGGEQAAVDPLTTPSSPAATAGTTPATPDSSPSAPAPSSPGASSTAPAAPVNRNIAIAVYNGTGINGLAKRAASALNGAEFPKAKSAGNWTGTRVSVTTVFYSEQSQAATAKAVASALEVGKAQQSDSADGGLVVVTAADLDSVIP
jgi:hypothetical protein